MYKRDSVTVCETSSSEHSLALSLRARESSNAPSELEVEVVSLFDELRGRLLRYVLSIGLPCADGEEIIQETFLALFQHLRLGRSRRNLRGWLFRVAHNLALKRISGNGRRCDVVELAARHAENHVDPAPTPEEQVTMDQKQARLQAVLAVLPPQDQCCLFLRAEGLRYREIADVLGMSLGSVSASLARSLARLGRVDGR